MQFLVLNHRRVEDFSEADFALRVQARRPVH